MLWGERERETERETEREREGGGRKKKRSDIRNEHLTFSDTIHHS